IAFYGYCSGDADRLSLENLGLSLKPCVTLLTEVSAIKRFKAGQYISYGRTWKATEDCDIALLPIGYADGLSRTLSSNLNIAINGKNYPLVGRICMDQCMVNLGMNSGVKRWDKAVIFGDKNYGALQDAQDIAKLAGTIPYEILTNISSRVPRVFM
ncbi:MAG: alanine racemase, partial [Treponema sp.]|nr:alanine racemase [Treponema sp.]